MGAPEQYLKTRFKNILLFIVFGASRCQSSERLFVRSHAPAIKSPNAPPSVPAL